LRDFREKKKKRKKRIKKKVFAPPIQGPKPTKQEAQK